MLKLTEKYATKPAPGTADAVFSASCRTPSRPFPAPEGALERGRHCFSAFVHKDDKDDFDPLETLPARSDSNSPADPAQQHQQAEVLGLIEQALARLPARQREAFLLRYWEELDVAETATAMGCSEGSVKTHCSRAVHALAGMLKARGVSL